MKFRYAISGIKRNLVFTLILTIQLIFAFYVLYNTIDIKRNVEVESSKIVDYFKDKKVYNLENQSVDSIFDNNIFPKVNEENLSKTFEELRNIPEVTFAHQVLFPILLEKFDGHENFKFYDPESDFEGRVFFQANNIILNEKSLKEFNIKLKEGRFFNFDENERNYADTNELPIIVGSNYEKYFKVGDEISYIRSDKGLAKAKVIGVLEENQYIPMDMRAFDSKRYVDLNNFILTSYCEFTDYEIMYDTMFGYNFILFNESTSDERIEEVKNKIKMSFSDNLDIKIDIKDLNNYIKSELDTYTEQENIISITAITIFIFITITLIISNLNFIYKRKKEFGVHIFSGGTMKDLAIIIYLEVLIVLVTSLIISLLVIFYQNNSLNVTNVKILFLTLIIISIITTILPITKILNLGINDIIKGVE